MLEFFRKYSAFAFIVLIVLFIGLVFMVDGGLGSGLGSGPKMMSLKGRGYTYSEVERGGADYRNLAFGVAQSAGSVDPELLAPYMSQILQYDPRSGKGTDEAGFFANRLVLKDLATKYGVTPSEAQIEKCIKERVFINSAKQFDQSGYTKFVQNRVKRYGLGVQDLNNLIGEMISMEKLQGVIGSGFVVNEELEQRSSLVSGQTMTFEQFTLPLDGLESAIEVSEEDIKAYWEKSQNNYLTDSQVKVEYVIIDAGLKEGEELSDEEKIKRVNTVVIKSDGLFNSVQDDDGKNFVKHAETLGLEVKTSELFTASTAPEEFKTSGISGSAAAVAQTLTANSGTMDSISDIFQISEGRLLMFQVIEKVEQEPLPFEKAKEAAKNALVNEKLSESMEELTAGLGNQLATADAAGTLLEKAKELGMTYTKRENAKMYDQFEDDQFSSLIFQSATAVGTGKLSDAVIQDVPQYGLSRVVFVKPLERTYVDSEENQAQAAQQIAGTQAGLNNVVFTNWFRNQVKQAEFSRVAEAN